MSVSYPYIRDWDGYFGESLVNLMIWDANHNRYITHHGAHIPARNASRLVDARNQIVRQFLDDPHTGEWLWCLDTDMGPFRPDILDRLMAFADPKTRPVVGALCFAGGWATPIYPTLFMFDQEHPLEDWPRDQPVQVDATGLACLLIHRSALERIAVKSEGHPRPWFDDGIIQGKEVGEDMIFCLRLKTLGIPVWVHTGIHIGHCKSWPLTVELYDAMRLGASV